MSGTAIPEEDRAALYVLGALNAEEMRAVRVEAERSDELARDIADWERRLSPLVLLIDPLAPPPSLWLQLETRLARISGGPERMGEVYQPPAERLRLRRRGSSRVLAYWQATAVGAMALAAALAAVIWLRQPPGHGEIAMVMPLRAGEGGWLLELRANGDIQAQAQGALTRSLNQDYELWALAQGADRPLPLGLLPLTAEGTIKSANLPSRKFKLLVSLEPKGGSPTGLPTGPVMFGSQILSK